MPAKAHKKFERVQHAEIYILGLKVQYKQNRTATDMLRKDVFSTCIASWLSYLVTGSLRYLISLLRDEMWQNPWTSFTMRKWLSDSFNFVKIAFEMMYKWVLGFSLHRYENPL